MEKVIIKGKTDKFDFLKINKFCERASYDQPRQHIKKQRHYFANKGPSSQGYGFSSSHVWMWELDYKESWVLNNWCFWTVVLEKTLESPLDCREIQPVHTKGDQSWVFIERTDVEAETPILRPPDAKSWLIGKDPDAGKDWGQEKGMTEDEMVGMASATPWTRVWVDSDSWWWTGRPGMLWLMGLQRVRHDWATELTSHRPREDRSIETQIDNQQIAWILLTNKKKRQSTQFLKRADDLTILQMRLFKCPISVWKSTQCH